MSPDYECTPQCAQKELDTAGIVRDAWSQHQVQCAILRLLQVSRRRWARSMRISAAFLFLFIVYTKVFPCTCIPPPQAKTVREHAAWYINQPNVVLIFEGKVTKQEVRNGATLLPDNAMSMTGWGRFRVVDFAVKRAFRGTRQDHISVLTGIGGGDCGYDFRTGRTYLVYASMGVGGVWFTNLCSGTNRIEDAGAALRLLSGEKPTSEDLLPPQDYWRQYFEKVIPKRTRLSLWSRAEARRRAAEGGECRTLGIARRRSSFRLRNRSQRKHRRWPLLHRTCRARTVSAHG